MGSIDSDPYSAAGQILAGPGDPLVAGVIAAKQAKAAREARDLASSKFLLNYADKHPELLAHPAIGAAYDRAIGVPGVHEQVLLKYAQDRQAAYENDPQASALAQALNARSGVRSTGLTGADRSFTAAPVDDSGASATPAPTGPSVSSPTESLAQRIPIPTGVGGVPSAQSPAGGGGGGGTAPSSSGPTLRPEATASFKVGDQTISVTGKGQREAQFQRIFSQMVDQYTKGGLDQGEAQTVAAQDAARVSGVIPEGFGDLVLAPGKLNLAGQKETIVQRVRTNFAQSQGYQRELGVRSAALDLPKNTEEDIASKARDAGLIGSAASDFKQNLRESFAAGIAGARAAGARGAGVVAPRSAEERAAAEALDRGLQPGQPDYNAFVRNDISTEAASLAGVKAKAGAEVREQYRMPSPQTQKVLTDVGIVSSVVGRMQALLDDPVAGPEIAASRGIISGRILAAGRKVGLDLDRMQSEAEKATGVKPKTLWDILTSQAQIIAVQPYLRGVRRYEFIQDARGHIPAPGDELAVTKIKLQELNTLANNYRDIALFYDRPVAMINADTKAGNVPVPLRGIISGGATPQAGVPTSSPGPASAPSSPIPLATFAEQLTAQVNAGTLSRAEAVQRLRDANAAAASPAP